MGLSWEQVWIRSEGVGLGLKWLSQTDDNLAVSID